MSPEMTRSLLHETSKALAESVAKVERLEKQNTRLRADLQQIADHEQGLSFVGEYGDHNRYCPECEEKSDIARKALETP